MHDIAATIYQNNQNNIIVTLFKRWWILTRVDYFTMNLIYPYKSLIFTGNCVFLLLMVTGSLTFKADLWVFFLWTFAVSVSTQITYFFIGIIVLQFHLLSINKVMVELFSLLYNPTTFDLIYQSPRQPKIAGDFVFSLRHMSLCLGLYNKCLALRKNTDLIHASIVFWGSSNAVITSKQVQGDHYLLVIINYNQNTSETLKHQCSTSIKSDNRVTFG